MHLSSAVNLRGGAVDAVVAGGATSIGADGGATAACGTSSSSYSSYSPCSSCPSSFGDQNGDRLFLLVNFLGANILA